MPFRAGLATCLFASLAACTSTVPFPPERPQSGPVVPVDSIGFIRPANGPTIAGFDGRDAKGIDIGGKAGDPVVAAAAGRVVYAGSGLGGYGNLVILKHNNRYLTTYAHNQAVLVKEGQSVRKGEKIAEMGSSDADRVKLHFEIRRKGKPVDPQPYLQAGAAQVSSPPFQAMPPPQSTIYSTHRALPMK
jgi:lipoprotein NlpD